MCKNEYKYKDDTGHGYDELSIVNKYILYVYFIYEHHKHSHYIQHQLMNQMQTLTDE